MYQTQIDMFWYNFHQLYVKNVHMVITIEGSVNAVPEFSSMATLAEAGCISGEEFNMIVLGNVKRVIEIDSINQSSG